MLLLLLLLLYSHNCVLLACHDDVLLTKQLLSSATFHALSAVSEYCFEIAGLW